MKRLLFACSFLLVSCYALGQDHTQAHDMPMPAAEAPADARDPHAYADGYTLTSGPYTLPQPGHLMMADESAFSMLLFDRLEAVDADENFTAWDVQWWYGNSYQRLVIKSEGDYAAGSVEESGTDFMFSRAVTPFWDAQLGLRQESGAGPDRSWLAFAIQGLAPYWFELDVSAYLGTSGRTALALDAEYDLLLTQRLILQPRLEMTLYGQQDKELGRGSGLSDIALGLRLRYEISRQFAPYIGVERSRLYGQSADFATAAGSKQSDTRVLAGLRLWF